MVIVAVACDVSAKKWEPIEWENPLVRFADLGIDPQMAASLINQGQMVITTGPRTIHVWNWKQNKIMTYENARVTYACMIINAGVQKIRDAIVELPNEKYRPKRPQNSNRKAVKRNRKNKRSTNTVKKVSRAVEASGQTITKT